VKADVLPIDSAEHQAVQLLLPWHGNALLSASETARVEAHVAQCPRCQADLAWQARLRSASAGVVHAESPSSELDRRWVALRQQLVSADAAAAHTQRRSPRWVMSLGWPFVLSAQAALLLAFALVAGWPPLSPQADSYRGLGAGPVNTTANAIIVFAASATEAQIRAALRAGDARLVGGPTVSDAYLLQLRTNDRATLAKLRGQPGVLRVESLEAEATR
jgi:anti-sigma factor RsiW